MGRERAANINNDSHSKLWTSRLWLHLWIAVVVGTGVILPAFLLTNVATIPGNSDFLTFYTAASLVHEGRAADAYVLAAMDAKATAILGQPYDGLHWLYPPGMLLAVWPFGQFSLTTAYILWLALGIGALALAASRLAPHPLTPLLVLVCPAVSYCAVTGQISLFAAAFAGAGFWLLARRPALAGLCFGIVTLKIQIALLLPIGLLAGRHYRSLLAMIATAILLEGAGVMLAGTGSLQAFFATSHEILGVVARRPELLVRLPTAYSFATSVSLSPWAAMTCQALASLASIVAIWVIWRRTEATAPRSLAWAAGAVLATPFLYDYDLAIFVIPLAAIAWSRWQASIGLIDALALTALWSTSFMLRFAAGAIGFQPGPLVAALLLVYAAWIAGGYRSADKPTNGAIIPR